MARGGLTRDGLVRRRDLPPARRGPAQRLRGQERCWSPNRAQSAARSARAPPPGVKVAVLPDALFQELSGTETAQGVMALVRPPEWTVDAALSPASRCVLVLDGLQDPGNAGTIVRAAEAFGATGVILPQGQRQPAQPEDAAGLGRLALPPALPVRHRRGHRPRGSSEHRIELYAGVPARPGTRPDPRGRRPHRVPARLIIGNEAHGVSAELALRRHRRLHPDRRRGVAERGGGRRRPALRGAPAKGVRAMSLFDNTPPLRARPAAPTASARSPSACGPSASRTTSGRSTCSAPASPCAARSSATS